LLLDHLVLVVDDLSSAISQFESRGFTVTPGGTNGPTHNALIVFSNDTYIELIALRSSRARLVMRMLRHFGIFALRRQLRNDLQTRLLSWMSGAQGLVDLCLRGTDLTEINELSPLSGMSLTDQMEWSLNGHFGVPIIFASLSSFRTQRRLTIECLQAMRGSIRTVLWEFHKCVSRTTLQFQHPTFRSNETLLCILSHLASPS
jgi:hypothetical protein